MKSTYIWWRGPRHARRGLSQGHRRKLMRQYGTLYPPRPLNELQAEMERIFQECMRGGTQPDWIYITDEEQAEALGLELGINHV